MNKFTVNGKEYKAKAFDFNLVCDLEDMKISLEQAATKPISMVRAYFGLCAGMTVEDAGQEIEKHIANGGNFDSIVSAMSSEMEKSDFFHNLSKTQKKEIIENKTN